MFIKGGSKLDNLTVKHKVIIAVVIVVCMISGYVFLQYKTKNDIVINNTPSDIEPKLDNEEAKKEDAIKETKEIVVHVSGRVKNPGVISILQGSRVNDAIQKAGGVLKDADLDGLNLASILNDGEKIYVPKIGQSSHIMPNTQASSQTALRTTIININTAPISELDKIPGVGPSTAQKIIDYRKANGLFASIEDIKNISGIGEKKFEKIKNYITI